MTPRTFYNGLLEQLGCEGRFYCGDARKLLHKQIEIMRGVQERLLVVSVDEAIGCPVRCWRKYDSF